MVARNPRFGPAAAGLVFAIAVLATPRWVPAQAPPPEAPVLDGTAEGFVRAAVAANPSLAAVRHRADAARSAVGTRGVLPDPMLGFGYFIETPETRVGPQESMWMLTQRLPFFG